jgi:hypothetical protein
MKTTKTPLESIHAFCVDCVGGAYEVKNCGGDKMINIHGSGNTICPFFRYRMGKGRPPLKIIRLFCLDCMVGSPMAVRKCTADKCPLHSYRMGKSPNRAGLGFAKQLNKLQKVLVSA